MKIPGGTGSSERTQRLRLKRGVMTVPSLIYGMRKKSFIAVAVITALAKTCILSLASVSGV